MSINFNYDNFRSSYGMQQIPVVRPQDVAAQEANKPNEQQIPQVQATKNDTAQQDYVKAPKIANLEDVSLTFNKEDSFDNIGMDADIASLDMAKAISDMKRDSILADYQTFVGPSEQTIQGLNDGVVIMK